MTFSLEEDEDVVVIGAQVCVMSDDGWDDESLTLDHQQRTGRETTSGWMKSCIRIMEDECIPNTTRRCPSNGNKETRERSTRGKKGKKTDEMNEKEGQSSSQLLERSPTRDATGEGKHWSCKEFACKKAIPETKFWSPGSRKEQKGDEKHQEEQQECICCSNFSIPFPWLSFGRRDAKRLRTNFEKKRTRRKDSIFKGNRVTISYRIEGYQVL